MFIILLVKLNSLHSGDFLGKWQTFAKDICKYILYKNVLCFDSNFTWWYYSYGSKLTSYFFGLGISLVPSKWQATGQTNGDPVHWHSVCISRTNRAIIENKKTTHMTEFVNHRNYLMMLKISTYVFFILYRNWISPRTFEWNSRKVIFKLVCVIVGSGISCEIALRWLSQDFTGDKSTFVQVMACSQAISHYLSRCWPNSILPYGVTKPQWINWYDIIFPIWIHSHDQAFTNNAHRTKDRTESFILFPLSSFFR